MTLLTSACEMCLAHDLCLTFVNKKNHVDVKDMSGLGLKWIFFRSPGALILSFLFVVTFLLLFAFQFCISIYVHLSME